MEVPDRSNGMHGRFEGQVAVITGVNDRGISDAIAERLADEGATVAVLWLERPTRLLKKLTKRGATFIDRECDVTNQLSVEAAIQSIVEQFGRIDVLVNNAGIDHSGNLGETSDDDWQRVVDVNLTGAMRVIRATLPHFNDDQS